MNNTTVRCPLVLVVDDNPRNLKLARDVLVAAGFRTIEAATGAEALALAAEHAPDVVLMDIRLPDMDGSAAARRLGDDPATSRIPVIAVSSLELDADADSLRALGFAGSIAKPIDVEAFPGQVRGFLR